MRVSPNAEAGTLSQQGGRTRIRRFPVAAVAVAAAAALTLAGCGSSGSRSTTSGRGSGPKGGPGQAAFRFATCMRDHGVTSFPEPQVTSSNGSTTIQIRNVANPHNPTVSAAQNACHGILPGPQNYSPAQLAARMRELVAFASCLRAHGLKNFPDPTPQGRLTLEMIDAAGIDLHQPVVLTAARACIGVTHGLINGAMVAHAIQEQGAAQGSQNSGSSTGS
jgi:hypothetical protein